MNSATPSFEISPEMRAIAEKNVEQARTAFNSYMSAAQNAVESMDGHAKAAQATAKDVGSKAMGYAGQNVEAVFSFVQQVVKAKDAQELAKLQSDFVQSQMKVLSDQAKDIGQSVSDTAMGMVKPK